MFSSFRYFPRKTAFRFLIYQTIFFTICLGFMVLSLRHHIGGLMNATAEDISQASDIDQFFIQLALVVLAGAVMYSSWSFYKFFYPLGRVLAKAKSIRRGTYKKTWDDDVVPGEDVGEWFELELTLNKINRQLKRRKQDGEQKQTELEALTGAVSDGIIAIDHTKGVRYFNGKMAIILGKEFDPLSPPSYLDEVFRAPKLTVAVDKVMELGELQRIQIQMRPSGTMENHIYDVVVSPVKFEKKRKDYGAIAVFNDITEFKKTEEMRIDFVANASHELKTPLTSIKGFMGALERDLELGETKMAQDKVAVINKNVSRLNSLVKDLLELSRIDATDEAAKEEIEIEAFTEETLRELKPQWSEKNHKLVTNYQANIVRANRMMLGQVLSNLVENAIKYCDDAAEIKVDWTYDDEHIKMEVSDTGDGVSSEHLNRLFERFYRVQNGKTRSGVMGTGLGLAIVKNCMLKQSGRVEVDSLPGKGATFTCYFPRV